MLAGEMRVAHIVDRVTAIGGVQTYLADLLPALAERGHEGVVIAAEESPAMLADTPVLHAPAIDADRATLDRGERHELAAVLKSARPDVVYIHIALSPGVAEVVLAVAEPLVYAHDYFMACPGGARYLHTRAAFCEEGPGLRCFVRAYTERCTNRRPDRVTHAYRRVRAWEETLPRLRRVLVASPFVAGVIEERGVEADRIRVVPYPIAPVAEVSEIETPTIDVLFVGRLIAAKGVHILLEAVARLPDVTVVIAGDGPERAALEALATRRGVDDRVEFVSWVSPADRPALFARSRVFALPSLWQEPFGIVGLEALAAGVPVVASDVGGIPSWLSDGEGGVLVPAGDPARLAESLERILGSPSLHAQLRARGRQVAGQFSMERHLELLIPELTAASR